jgi:hypothetical protein
MGINVGCFTCVYYGKEILMSGRCCDKPMAKIIKIGGIDVGIIGLEEAFRQIYQSGVDDDEILKRNIFLKIKEFGNYVTPSREEVYKETLLPEYRKFQQAVQEAVKRRYTQQSVEKKKWSLFRKDRKDS